MTANDELNNARSGETAEQRRERRAQALVDIPAWRYLSALVVADVIETSDRAAGCDPEALRGEIERLKRELAEAEGAFWRVAPNTHTLAPGKPDPFEGAGETYPAAYDRLRAEVERLNGIAGLLHVDLSIALRERDDLATRLAVVTGERDASIAREVELQDLLTQIRHHWTNSTVADEIIDATLADLPARAAVMLRALPDDIRALDGEK